MANCNKLFLDFEKAISLTPAKREKLVRSRKALEKKIISYFKEKEGISIPRFYIQGSYIMDTMIRKKDGTYDVDLGVYFREEPKVSARTTQQYVLNAVEGHTEGGAKHLQKCIRVIYAGDYNIDLPVYYKSDQDEHPHLAIKDSGWELSDPKELREWFNSKKDKNGQLRRIVKYLKIWADLRSFKMPSGIALTVWAAENYQEDERDDISLFNTLKGIQAKLNASCDCINPKTPGDNMTGKLDSDQKEKFRAALGSFIDDAEFAIESNNQLKASKKWIRHLGEFFPLGADEDVDSKQAALNLTKASILKGMARTNRQGEIQESEGIKNKPHRNYGGYE